MQINFKITNKNILIYLILIIIILYVAKHKSFSYVFILIILLVITIYYFQLETYYNMNINIYNKDKYIKYLNIDSNSLLSRDLILLEILYKYRFIYKYALKDYDKLINIIEKFFITYESLDKNINNIFLAKTDIIKPHILNRIEQSLLINDLGDQLDRILKHINNFIYVLPSDIKYLNAFYEFNQLINYNLSKYYNKFRQSNNYQSNNISNNKYGFFD
jgi:hypothetical protein